MLQLGIESVTDLSLRSGVSKTSIWQLLNFRLSPRGYRGKWRKPTLAICKALGSEPSDLFPEHLDHEVTTNLIASFVEHAQITGKTTLQLDACEQLQQAEMEQTVDEVLGTLTDREGRILKARFWEGKTMAETGREHKVSGGRISQIVAKSFRKLRTPTCLKKLEGVWDHLKESA